MPPFDFLFLLYLEINMMDLLVNVVWGEGGVRYLYMRAPASGGRINPHRHILQKGYYHNKPQSDYSIGTALSALL